MAVCPRRPGAITADMLHYIRVRDVSCRAQLYKEVRCVRADLIHSANRPLSPLPVLTVGDPEDAGVRSRSMQKTCTQGGALLSVLHFTVLQPQVNESRMSCNELLQHVARIPLPHLLCDGDLSQRTFFLRLSDKDVNEDAE